MHTSCLNTFIDIDMFNLWVFNGLQVLFRELWLLKRRKRRRGRKWRRRWFTFLFTFLLISSLPLFRSFDLLFSLAFSTGTIPSLYSSNRTSLLIRILCSEGFQSLYAFEDSPYPTWIHSTLLESNFCLLSLGTCTYAVHPKTLILQIEGFPLVHASSRVTLQIALVEI